MNFVETVAQIKALSLANETAFPRIPVKVVVEEVGYQEDGWPGGDWQSYRCKDCGLTWEEELPQ